MAAAFLGSVAQHLTQPGALLGTFPYVAPELERGQSGDAGSDQYAFCVSLYEGLYGARPFQGRGKALTKAKALAHYAELEPEAVQRVPDWLGSIVKRGLDPDPSRRYPTLDSLLQALANDPERLRRRRRWIAVGASAVALVALGVGAAGWLSWRQQTNSRLHSR